jgi:hypothetical protein
VKVQENKDKQTQHFFLFNDILVHIRASMLKGGIDLSLPEFTWPLQLVWFREHEKEKVEVIGPSGSLLIKKTSETTQWIHDLREGSKNWCQRQNENDNSTANGSFPTALFVVGHNLLQPTNLTNFFLPKKPHR